MIGVVSSSLLGVKMDKERSCVRDLLEIIREIIVGSLESSRMYLVVNIKFLILFCLKILNQF